MTLPGLGAIKNWLLAAAGFLLVLCYAILKGKDAANAKAAVEREKRASRVKDKAHKATMDGLNREQEAVENAKADISKSNHHDHFES